VDGKQKKKEEKKNGARHRCIKNPVGKATSQRNKITKKQ
jgi:hypothetical protein